MVILNNHKDESRTLSGDRFDEILSRYGSGKDIITGDTVTDKSSFNIKAKSIKIIEFKK